MEEQRRLPSTLKTSRWMRAGGSGNERERRREKGNERTGWWVEEDEGMETKRRLIMLGHAREATLCQEP